MRENSPHVGPTYTLPWDRAQVLIQRYELEIPFNRTMESACYWGDPDPEMEMQTVKWIGDDAIKVEKIDARDKKCRA